MYENVAEPLPIPVSILTGFLGSGKTTLLNKLVKHPALRGAAVFVNEFGEIGLDHELVEHVDEGVVLLAAGCLCCTVRGDLERSAIDLLFRIKSGAVPPVNRLIVETTGLADPAPILASFVATELLLERFRLDGVVATVDAQHGPNQLSRNFEAVKQVAMADRVLVTKTDRAAAPAVDALTRRLRRLNPAAPIAECRFGDIDPALILDCGLYEPAGKTPDVARWLRHEIDQFAKPHSHGAEDVNRHDARIRAIAYTREEPVDWEALMQGLDTLFSLRGDHILRMKGIAFFAGREEVPRALHGVHHMIYPEVDLPGYRGSDRRTRFVFIVRDLDPRIVVDTLDGFLAPQGAGNPTP